ncbi:MAG: FAD:protein FMN transferase [Lachnospiraceae bacterium]|nr:FAD:protein FMN transferase [Lachnospiraceae bacterium]
MTRTALFSRLLPVLTAFSCVISAAPACAASPLADRTGFFFDTVISIALYDTADESILDACFEELAGYEQKFSRTLEGSEIWQVNHSGGQPVTVSEDTYALIEDALSYCALSDGWFDITIASVVDLWDFSSAESALDPVVPDADALAEALAHVDWHCIELDPASMSVTLTDPEAKIDLGGIAKGWISGRMHDRLLELGCESAMINLGGNVVSVGTKPDGSSWNIGIRKPFAEVQSDLIAVVPLNDQAVITSGTYERYFTLDGQLYHHILDPHTGLSVDNGLTSVSILTPDPTAGDALSTICFMLGIEDGLALIESLDDTEALLIDEDMNFYPSSGWTGRAYP